MRCREQPLTCVCTLPFSLCLQRHDLFFSSAATGGGGGGRRRGRVVKPNVVLASYETVLKDRGLFTVGGWWLVRCPSCGLRVSGCIWFEPLKPPACIYQETCPAVSDHACTAANCTACAALYRLYRPAGHHMGHCHHR